jgi:hypothetical protein
MLIKRDNIESKDESEPEFTFFSIDCDPQSESDTHEITHIKSELVSKLISFQSIHKHSFSLRYQKVND